MTAIKPVCSNCGQPLPSGEAVCSYCSNEPTPTVDEPTQPPDLPRFVYGFLFSIPVLILGGAAGAVADSIDNELGLLLIGLGLLVSLPWSIIGIVMYLSTFSMGSGLKGAVIGWASLAVIIGGAHLNGVWLLGPKSPSRSSEKDGGDGQPEHDAKV